MRCRPGEGSRLGAIAERAGLPKSTVHRILRRLVERGYARAQGDGVYVLGPRILALAGGMLDQLNAGPAGRAVLRSLHADVGHTVHFAMLLGDEAVYVEKLVDPDLPYQTASRVGMRIPLHCTSIGKALLAAMPPEEAASLLGRGRLARRTEKTLVTTGAAGGARAGARARVRDRRRGERAQHPLRRQRGARPPRPPRRSGQRVRADGRAQLRGRARAGAARGRGGAGAVGGDGRRARHELQLRIEGEPGGAWRGV